MPSEDAVSRQMILEFPALPEFHFSNFVVSEGSRLAFNAAQQICSDPAPPYHTLYLTGNKGLGKTHLLISIGNFLAENRTGQKALYVHGADFTKKMTETPSSQANPTLQRMLGVDFFLMDDIDRVAGHPAAQEKLYLVYNTLLEKGKRIAFTSRRKPFELEATESYLTSRFQWGMVAEIKPMDEAATSRIIKKLGSDMGLSLPDQIVEYLLHRIPRDFPSVKNTITQINRESFIQKKKVTLPLVKTVLDQL